MLYLPKIGHLLPTAVPDENLPILTSISYNGGGESALHPRHGGQTFSGKWRICQLNSIYVEQFSV